MSGIPEDKNTDHAEQHLDLVLAASALGAWTWDRGTDALELSDRACEIFALPPGTRITRSEMRKLLPVEDRERASQALQTSLAHRSDYRIEYALRPPDGTLRWIAASGRCLIKDDAVTGMVGVLQDITERIETAHALREARERLETTLFAAEVGTWTWDLHTDHVIADGNLAFLFFLDSTRTTGVAQDFIDCIHRDDRSRVQSEIAEAMMTGLLNTDFRIVRPDGSERWIIARARMERDSKGCPWRMPGIVLDITDRKHEENKAKEAHRQLREQSHIYNTALSVTDDFSYFFDLQGRFTFANRPLLEVWGKTLGEIIGKNCFDLGYPKWHANLHMQEIQKVISTKQSIKGEVPYTSPTGTFGIYEYIFKPVLNAEGNVSSIAGTTRNVTDRKRAEAIIARQYQILQLLAEDRNLDEILGALLKLIEEESGPRTYASIMLLDHGAKRLYHAAAPSLPFSYNEGISGMSIGPAAGSCGRAAWSGKPVYVSDIATDPLWASYRNLALSNGLRACWSCPIQSSDGKTLGTFAMYYGQVREPQETDRRILETATRTAAIAIERKQAEEVLKKSRREAENANRAKDRFLAVLSHELRTPLTPVLMTVTARQMDPDLPQDLRNDLAIIRRNLDLEVTLIDDMLDMSRIMSGKLRLRLENLAVDTVLIEACLICRPMLLEKSIRLECNWGKNLDFINADPARLKQVFWNILNNAIKFTESGGLIQISTSRCDREVIIRIKDSGRGIARNELSKIFDAFEQGSSAGGGLGLGLAISKALVDLHGGTIAAESEGSGQGSTFTISLPVTEAKAKETSSDSPSEQRTSQHLRLLVVEDHADTAFVLCHLLEIAGFIVHYAGTLAEARKIANTQKIDVLVSDVGLPDGTGYELMAEFRQRNIIGIAMSGYGMEEDICRGRDAGFLDHLIKPVDVTVLQKTIQKLASSPIPLGNAD